jgi:hypothetical protein
VPQNASQQLNELAGVIAAQPPLRALRDELVRLHKVVFHSYADARVEDIERSAEQILITEIVSRHHGRPEVLLDTLQAKQASGTSHADAVRELVRSIHSYYTTPLGVVMRQDLFGNQAVFLTPDAQDWTTRQRGRSREAQA